MEIIKKENYFAITTDEKIIVYNCICNKFNVFNSNKEEEKLAKERQKYEEQNKRLQEKLLQVETIPNDDKIKLEIEYLKLPTRPQNALIQFGHMRIIEDIYKTPVIHIRGLRQMGNKSFQDLQIALSQFGLPQLKD